MKVADSVTDVQPKTESVVEKLVAPVESTELQSTAELEVPEAQSDVKPVSNSTDPAALYMLLKNAADSFASVGIDESVPVAAPLVPVQPQTSLDHLLISDDEQFTRITSDRNAFNQYMKNALAQVRESAIVDSAAAARKVSQATIQGQKIADAFYTANPDLAQHRAIVREMAAAIAATNPFYNSDPAALMVASAAAARQYIAMKSQTGDGRIVSQSQQSKPVTPVKKAGAPVRQPVVTADNKHAELMQALFGKR